MRSTADAVDKKQDEGAYPEFEDEATVHLVVRRKHPKGGMETLVCKSEHGKWRFPYQIVRRKTSNAEVEEAVRETITAGIEELGIPQGAIKEG